ncbi:MAG: EAL domain-containing protein [Lachnospiraceae bacterium]|nr:EAL domain-containing protein [Lachnospiraceae bacterium]
MPDLAIMIVEDEKINRTILARIFRDEYQIYQARNGRQGLDLLETGVKVDLVLLDLVMPVMNGIEFLKNIKSDQRFTDIPVIVTTQNGDPDRETEVFELGADDFVTKPYNVRALTRRVNNLIQKYVLEKREMEEQLQFRKRRDVLTGIYNRTTFYEAAQKMIQENPEENYVIAVWDIDHFKMINELFGNLQGDQMLIRMSDILKESIPPGKGVYGRLEADHFATCALKNVYQNTKESIKELINRGIQGDILDYPVFVHVGLYGVTNNREESVSTMCDRAKLALQTVKSNALQRFCYYKSHMSERLYLEQELVNDFEQAMQEKQFYIQLQPVVDTVSGEVISAEALVRWNHPQKGFISPGDFIPIFEKNNFIIRLDYYVWEEVCRFLSENRSRNLANVPISINISRKNFLMGNLESRLLYLLDKYQIPVELLKLEVTESAYMEHPDQILAEIQKLQKKGFVILMDDFGSGYSSLNMLKNVPVDILKIDMIFIANLEDSKRGSDILHSVVELTKRLKMQTVAEGVETKQQYRLLKKMGCDSIQGYYFSKPMLPEAFLSYVEQHSSSVFLEQELKDDKKLILIADALEAVRVSVGGMLRDRYRVLTAEDGKAAYHLLEQYKDRISFVLTAIHMPRMDGRELIRAMKNNANLREIPIMVLSADGASETALETLSLGALDIINKPVEPDVLKARVGNILEDDLFEHETAAEWKKKQMRLDSFINNVPDGLCMYYVYPKQKPKVMIYNDGYCRLCGYTREEMSEKVFQDPFHSIYAEDFPRMREEQRMLMEGRKQETQCIYRIVKKDGEIAWVLLKARVNQKHDYMEIYTSYTNITEWKMQSIHYQCTF